ncbi:hypothetical protein VPH35_054309 [Triticum aestivum]|uniref:Uncharacterized protein n=1 Tax=Triticum aestivum TaxID=4565 RepID=A0A077RXI7_WHEAT|nr:unnamed protein product [Triticum aestivum]
MTPPQQCADRRPPPLGLRGLSRVAFQPRSPPPGGLPPLGLTGRSGAPSFSIGTAGFERLPPPTTLPRRHVGLTRPSRAPAPNEAGSSNWSASVGEAGTGSGGFVGFHLINGSGGMSFGGGGGGVISFGGGGGGGSGISFGGGGSESLDFTFRTGAGANRSEGSSHGGSREGIGGNEGTIGYRGPGYNPNFSHADEYPPSQEAVQTQRQPIDLNVLSNKETRRQYRIDDRRHIYTEIIARNGTGNRLKHGVSKAAALACKCPRRIVQRETRGALVFVLQTIRELSPKAFVIVEQGAGHNYAALFYALDMALLRYDVRHARVEQFHFGAEIHNVVGCEGVARVERNERADQWRRRMSRAGFLSMPFKMAAKAREWLEENAGGSGYTVAEEKGRLVCLDGRASPSSLPRAGNARDTDGDQFLACWPLSNTSQCSQYPRPRVRVRTRYVRARWIGCEKSDRGRSHLRPTPPAAAGPCLFRLATPATRGGGDHGASTPACS